MLRHEHDAMSTRQVFFIASLICIVNTSRFLPGYLTKNVGPAAWYAPVFTLVPCILFCAIFNYFLKLYSGKSMAEIINTVLGRVIGSIVNMSAVVWLTLFTAITMRMFSVRQVTVFTPNANIDIFLFVIVLSVGFFLHFKTTIIARMGEIVFLYVFAIFILSFVPLIGLIQPDNLEPLKPESYSALISQGFIGSGVWGFGLYAFFLTEKVTYKPRLKKSWGYFLLFLLFTSLIIMITTIGSLGSDIIPKMSYPFFTALKQVSILEVFNRVELLFALVVGLIDYIASCVYMLLIFSFIKGTFRIDSTKPFIWIYMLLVGALSKTIAVSSFEMLKLIEEVFMPGNIVFTIGLPLLLCAVSLIRGHGRKKQNKRGAQG